MTSGRLGVAGAGTMGAGIAQLACLAGFEIMLHDYAPGGDGAPATFEWLARIGAGRVEAIPRRALPGNGSALAPAPLLGRVAASAQSN